MNKYNKKDLKIQYTGFKTILNREVIRILRIWPQTLLPSVITMVLYFVIFGNLIGSRIGDMGGFSYMMFIIPGLIMMGVITNSYSNVSSSFFGIKFQRSIEEILVSPLSIHSIILGFILGGIFRGFIVGILIIIISMFFTNLVIYNIFLIGLILLLTSTLFSLAGLINAVYAKKFDDVSIVPTFVLTPLTYFAGVFYSIDLLPQIWQTISLINPILYIVNSFRYGFLGVSDINVNYSVLAIILIIGILYYINYYLLKKGIGMRN